MPYRGSLLIYTLAILCFVLSPIAGYAQATDDVKHDIDSLYQRYLTIPDDSTRLEAYVRMARTWRYVDVDSSKFYLRLAIQKHIDAGFESTVLAFAYNVIADIYKKESNLDSAFYYYQEAYYRFEHLEDKRPLLAIVPTYGKFLVSNGEPEMGIAMFQNAIEIAERTESFDNLSFLNLYLGDVYYNIQKNGDKAFNIYLRGVDASNSIGQGINFSRVSAFLNIRLSNIYFDKKDMEKSIEFAQKAIPFAEETKLFHVKSLALNNLTRGTMSLGDYVQARKYNFESLGLQKPGSKFHGLIEAKILAQELKIISKNYNVCILEGEDIFEDYGEVLTISMKADLYDNLCDCYLNNGNLKKGLDAKDSLLVYTNDKLISEHDELLAVAYNDYQYKEQIAENELLKIRQSGAEKELKLQKLTAIGLISALLLSIALILVVYRSNLRKKKLNEELEQTVALRTKELIEANKGLEQTNSELRTLSFIASHDIKEPIRNIGNYIGLIRRRFTKENQLEFEEEFKIIKNSTEQLYTLIEDFTSYVSHSKSGEMPIEEVDMEVMVVNIRNNILLLNDYSNGQIVFGNLPALLTNKSAIFLILNNVIENGLKYNVSEIPEVRISSRIIADEVQFIIEDNGIGIDAQFRDKIFGMFKRLHGQNEFKGSGMGLSIVKLLLGKIDGHIRMEDAPTAGSRFIISFPRAILAEPVTHTAQFESIE